MSEPFRFKEIVNTYDTTPDGRLSPITPLQLFQEVAQRHLQTVSLGLDFMFKNNLAWILVKYEIEFLEYPKGEEEIIVETEATGYNRFEASRRFTIYSTDGKELIKGKSIWVLVDTKSGKLVRISNVKEIERLMTDDNFSYKIPRLKNLNEFDETKSFDVRYFDIDINKHVNNTKYLVWGVESLPLETVLTDEIKKVTIVYKEQAFYGETVEAKVKKVENDLWRVDIVNKDDRVLCQIEIQTRKRDVPLNES